MMSREQSEADMVSSAPPPARDPDEIQVTIAHLVAAHATERGDAIAVEDAHGALTYAELAGIAAQIASAAPGEGPVGILLPVSNAYIVAIVGLLARGVAYVPMDASFPAERNRDIAASAGLTAIVVDASTAAAAAEIAPAAVQIVMPDSAASGLLTVATTPGDTAVIFFTSGSTGQPKGVPQRHANILYEVLRHCWRAGLTAEDRVALVYSPSVSGSTRDIYGSLAAGARLCLVDVRRAGLGGTLAALARAQVTVLHAIPGLFRAMFAEVNAETKQLAASVRLVHLISDRVLESDVELWRARFPRTCRLCIDLATTETYSYASWYLDHDAVIDRALVPVGYPRPDMIVRLIDENGAEVAPGTLGEIVVSGRSLSLGYWRAQELTAERFSPSAVLPGGTDYRTGDMGRLLPGGLLELAGRKDRQVKLSGNTVHLAEIEAMLARCPGVVEAGVVARGASPAIRLIAYCAGEASGPAIAAWCAERLPGFMRPAEIVIVDALPKLPGGKPDPAGLAALDAERARAQTTPAARPIAASEAMRQVQDAWEALLASGSFDRDLPFGEAGGDSLKGLSLILQLENRLERALPPTILDMATRPSELTGRLARLADTPSAEDARPLLLFFPGINGADTGLGEFGRGFDRAFRFAVVDYRDGGSAFDGSFDADRLFAAVEAQAEGAGAVWLLGYSYGGKIAVEAARRLQARGAPVAFAGVIDGLPRDTFLAYHNAAVRGLILGERVARGKAAYGGLYHYVSGGVAQKWGIWLLAHRRYRALDRLLRLLRLPPFRAAEIRVRRAVTATVRMAALAGFPAGPVAGTLHLFFSAERRFAPELYPSLGWEAYCDTVKTAELPGAHLDLLSGEAAAALAATLDALAAGR
jgi:amino acid adenylation domain-containing protein